jgi:hypothetical protein
MLILILLVGSGIAVLCSGLIWLLPIKHKTSTKESFAESSERRDMYLAQMRRDRFENSTANQLGENP